jgi:hypothetical protein
VSPTGGLLAVVIAWVVIGIVASIAMGRRGHHPFTWGALGAVLGPLIVPLAWQDVKREQGARTTHIVAPGTAREGVEVLIGIDGSASTTTPRCPPSRSLLSGRPAQALQQHATDSSATLLVIGTRGRGASKLIFGSVASASAHHAHTPTLIVAAKTSKTHETLRP